MDEKDRRMLNFVVSSEEAESIDSSARTAGLSRSDYIRKRLLAQPSGEGGTDNPLLNLPLAPSKDSILLLQHALYGIQKIYAAVYRFAEISGGFSEEELDEVGDRSTKKALDFINNLDARMAKTRQLFAEHKVATQPATETK